MDGFAVGMSNDAIFFASAASGRSGWVPYESPSMRE
jgi:hypothetical protein